MRANRLFLCVLFGVGLWLGLSAHVPSSALARHAKRPKASAQDQQQAQALVGSGTAALAAKKYSEAKAAFEEAFRKNPAPEVMFQLGKLAEAEGRIVGAQDVMRRFLQETSGENEGPDQKEALRITQLEAPASGEVTVLGARGAWVSVDEHLVGALPLQTPLLLESGTHRIIVELNDQRIEEQVKALPGQTVEMRFNQKTGTVVVSVPPALVLLIDGDLSAEQQKSLTAAVGKQVARERQVVVPGDKAIKLRPALASCLASTSCLVELGNANEALYVVKVSAQRTGSAAQAPTAAPTPTAAQAAPEAKAAWKIGVQVLDPSVGDVAARSETSCEDCTIEQAFSGAATTIGSALQQSTTRVRGQVEVTSSPVGADVVIAGEKVGVTPYKGSRFVGEHPLEVRLLGQPTYTGTLSVKAGQVAQVEAQLGRSDEVAEPEPIAPPPTPPPTPVYRTERGPRPKWRLALGGSLIGAGAVLVGFGLSALSVDGKSTCPGQNCQLIYETTGVGTLLTGVGIASIAGGIVTVALPGPKRQVRVK